MERGQVQEWVAIYERAWRTAGTALLGDLFSPVATYRPSPWGPIVEGLDAIRAFWDAEREGPDEDFTMTSELVAVEGQAAVVRVAVDYASRAGGQWRDLWVLEFDRDGRCIAFEEWPFAPQQRDGHER